MEIQNTGGKSRNSRIVNLIYERTTRTIIELLIHNIPTNGDLDKIITELGFGDRSEISRGWKHYELNILTVVDTNWRELP